MMYLSVVFLLISGRLGALCSGQLLAIEPGIEKWTNNLYLDEQQQYHLRWLIQDKHVTFEVEVETTGYIGLGFSPGGGMTGADIIIAWVDEEGKAHVEDRFATGYEEPIKDEQQDVELINGTGNVTHTLVRFRRKLQTCDPYDFIFEADATTRVLFAFHHEDPVNGTIKQHTQRGVKSLVLVGGDRFDMSSVSKNDNITTWDVLNVPTDVPSDKHTIYHCTVHKAPELSVKHQMIGWRPLIENAGVPYVHHIVAYACYSETGEEFEPLLNSPGYDCYTTGAPVALNQCSTLLLVWAVGGEGQMLEPNVGFPVGWGDKGATYFMLEVHYDNHRFLPGVKGDRSGIQVILSPNLRPQEAWSVNLGHEYTDQIIPPGQERFKSVGHCTANCLSQVLPQEGITATHAMLHTHLAGTSLILRHFRNGVELPPIIEDKMYDFNLQVFRKLEVPVNILPGDNLLTECIYNTTSRENVTWGGLATIMEMCIVNLQYYPRIHFGQCFSHPYLGDMGELFGFKPNWTKQLLSEEPSYKNVVETFDLESNINNIQEFVESGRYQEYCVRKSRMEPLDQRAHDYPSIRIPYSKKKKPTC